MRSHGTRAMAESGCDCKPCAQRRELTREQKRASHQRHRSRNNERSRAYHRANREKANEKSRAYYQANRERLVRQRREYVEANRERVAKSGEAYRKKNPAAMRARSRAKHEAATARMEYARERAWRPSKTRWTPEEELLLASLLHLSDFEIALQVGRTEKAVSNHRQRLRLLRTA